MPKVDLDLGGVGQIPDEGVYRLHCDKAILKPNKTKDGLIINLQMQLVDMEDETFENHPMFDNPSLKVTARWKIKEVLEAFTQEVWDEDGMELDWQCEQECEEENPTKCPHPKHVEILEDKIALGICYADEYNGKPQLRVRTYLPDDGQVETGPQETQ